MFVAEERKERAGFVGVSVVKCSNLERKLSRGAGEHINCCNCCLCEGE